MDCLFLTNRIFPGSIKLVPRSKQRFAEHLRDYEQKYFSGEWSEAELQRHMQPVTAFAMFADSDALRSDIIRRYGKVA
jgi:hypothetical protein